MSPSGRVLVYWPSDDLRPVGGPRGYLWNLKEGLDEATGVEFLPPARGQSPDARNSIKRRLPSWLLDVRRLLKYFLLPFRRRRAVVSLNDFDAVHFHRVEDICLVRSQLRDYNGTVILTSHTPCAPHLELLERLGRLARFGSRLVGRRLERMSRFAFERANVIVFPCAWAEEPYFNTWPAYHGLRDRWHPKIRYLPTGIVSPMPRRSRQDVRDAAGVPHDAFVACFVGRHNLVKGYDLLARAARELFDEEFWFVLAGGLSSIGAPNDSHWIEMGWTDDPAGVVAAADVVVVPNRETYFDLAVLEAIALGAPIIASNTGGNRLFAERGADGVILYDEPAQLAKAIREIRNVGPAVRAELGTANRRMYEDMFTERLFASRYISLLREL